MPDPMHIPYVALGDSLTHGVQSMGLCWLSQAYSYPKQIADFIGAEPFHQPVLKGWLPGNAPPGQQDNWVGNPPNLELVLRRAEALLGVQPGTPVNSSVWRQLHDEVETIAAALREAITDYVRVVEDTDPADLLVEPVPEQGYQNLGVFGFSVLDVSTVNYASLRRDMRISFRGQLAKIARQAIESASDTVRGITQGHPSLLQSLTLALLAIGEHDFGARMQAQRTGYVLGAGATTALEAARAQNPQIVTLWIGNNDVLNTMCGAHIWDGDTPLYTLPDVFRKRLAWLMDEILSFDSRPALFAATLPSPTSSPNLVRDRMGHWKSLLPSAAFLLDGQLLELETIVGQYNDILAELVHNRAGRAWLVDVHGLQERMQRATRRDAEATRRVVTHAVRAGHINAQAGHAAWAAARAGNLDTLRHILEVDARLSSLPFTELADLPPQQSGAYLAHDALTAAPERTNVDAFVVRLASGKTYRLTGEYLSAGDLGEIAQGGSVSLDAIHLTNTGYAYIAREFLATLYRADAETRGAVLRGLRGQQRSPAQFDAQLLKVARDDSLLNSVPRLLPAVLDASGAVADLLGELHFSDPYLTR